jgi:succinate dehydrogenase / fumarate reductase cytochrome b subunit
VTYAFAEDSFLARHEFLLRRLHSLSGVIPVGAYMCIHLLTNASVNNGAATFQNSVYQIHSLGIVLPIVEWVFIFIPILFHALYGVLIIRNSQPNSGTYTYGANRRYSAQRVTGMIAFLFIVWHVLHMHGWIHADWWIKGLREMGHAQFAPYNATSTAARAMQASVLVPILYSIGMLSCVFHLANGIWTFGITWGLWLTPTAQRRALVGCGVFGVLLAVVGLSSVTGFMRVNVPSAAREEAEMYDARVKTHMIDPNEHKLWTPTHDETPATAKATDAGADAKAGEMADGASDTPAEPNSDQ